MHADDQRSSPDYPTSDPLKPLAFVIVLILAMCGGLSLLLLAWWPTAIGLAVYLAAIPFESWLLRYELEAQGP